MNSSPSPDRMNEVRSLLKAGNKIAAIKVYREITGVGLAEAKQAVEAMPLDPNAPSAGNLPTNAPQRSGCSGMIAVIAGAAAIVGWWIA
jgi:Ribosomal protein L7/L12 C-terminal domain